MDEAIKGHESQRTPFAGKLSEDPYARNIGYGGSRVQWTHKPLQCTEGEPVV